jgi:hypothetical protein
MPGYADALAQHRALLLLEEIANKRRQFYFWAWPLPQTTRKGLER